MSRLLLMLLVLPLAAPVYGADEGNTPLKANSERVRKEAGEAIGAAADKARQERDEFTAKARKELDDLNAKIADLKMKAQEVGKEGKAALDKQVRNLEQKQKLAERKFAKLESATSEKWRELKDGVSRAIDQLKQSVQKTTEDFREGS